MYIDRFIKLLKLFYFLRDVYPNDFSRCQGAFRHKNYQLQIQQLVGEIFENPEKYVNYGFHKPFFSIVAQRPGDLIITFEKGHGGFNVGFNINEAANMGYDNWYVTLNYIDIFYYPLFIGTMNVIYQCK